MKTPEERRTAVYQLGSARLRERKRRLRNTLYCALCIVFVCSTVFILNYITTQNNISESSITGSYSTPIESIEIIGNGIKKKVTDRPTVTQISICIKDMIKGDYICADDLTTVYTVTFVYEDKQKTVFRFTEDGIIVDEKYYTVNKEDYDKLLNYFK